MDEYYAHTKPGSTNPTDWEPLEVHLRLVAEGAAGFAEAFAASDWGRVAGLWHDLGKYSAEFQAYLRQSQGLDAHVETPGRVDHSTAGAQNAIARFPERPATARILAYCIAGHHGGLSDGTDTAGGTSGLDCRLKKVVPSFTGAPESLLNQTCPTVPAMRLENNPFRLAVFCRTLFSCLVDADYLATESFMSPEQSSARVPPAVGLSELSLVLDAHLDTLPADTPVNRRRREVLEQCRKKSDLAPGLFSLTVPTGGGKTLSSLAFALRHAVHHNLRRVVYAIPFTSIIEQNADVFRSVFSDIGSEVVLEHHTNLDPDKETPRLRLASENWDSPIVVTTNVQLLESLFACQPSRCRKLHRLTRSVIILDEAQALPVELLKPTLAILDELCRNYGCTVVLCSATQPAVNRREEFPIGLADVREIIDDAAGLFGTLRRVDAERLAKLTDEALTARLAEHDRVLCVVNTRPHAARLYQMLRELRCAGTFHLSAQMCPAHRGEVISRIRTELDSSRQCRVISTQLIEAGVDIDFPVVYRAMAGLDSIAQAAGRCNREGRLRRGRLYVFETDAAPNHEVKQAAQHAAEVMPSHADVLGLKAVEEYFSVHYWIRQGEWDKRAVMPCFSMAQSGPHFQFREAAERYRLIREEQKPVIVPYGRAGRRVVDELEACVLPPGRRLLRRLQRFTVGMRDPQIDQLIQNCAAAMYFDQFCVLGNEQAYDTELGVRLNVSGFDAASLII